jgi:predicted O-methyltransferase YrrM
MKPQLLNNSLTQQTTIEGAREIAAVATENFKQLGLNKYIQQRTGNFDEVLPDVLKTYEEVDVAFIDGNHRYAPTLYYFEMLLPKIHNNSMLIFDDIYWSKGMTKAWEEIKEHPQVTVTVDLFFIGLVFFRKEQVKEHFKLRIW